MQRISELCKQGLGDDEIAQLMTQEGFHTAQRSGVNPAAIRNIRMQYAFHLQRHSKRGACKVDGCWTTHGLAVFLDVDADHIYRRIRKGVIDPTHVHFDQSAEIYLIDDYPGLIETLRESFVKVSGTNV